jgi:hypothetical protein
MAKHSRHEHLDSHTEALQSELVQEESLAFQIFQRGASATEPKGTKKN